MKKCELIDEKLKTNGSSRKIAREGKHKFSPDYDLLKKLQKEYYEFTGKMYDFDSFSFYNSKKWR